MARVIIDEKDDPAELERGVEAAKRIILHAIEQPARALARVAEINAIKTARFTAERERAAAELGVNHPVVRLMDVRLEVHRDVERVALLRAKREATPVIEPAADEWVLYGWVRRSDDEGARGLHVALFSDGHKLGDAATTDADGYYRLALHRGQHMEDAAKRAASPVGLRVLDAAGALLLEPPDRFDPVAGTADRLEVWLTEKASDMKPDRPQTEKSSKPAAERLSSKPTKPSKNDK